MTDHQTRTNADPVSLVIQRANRLLDGSPSYPEVSAFAGDLAELNPRDLARFEWQARSWISGVNWPALKRLRWPVLRGARKALWQTLALASPDGYERERAIKTAPADALHVQLIVVRCLDWVDEVRDAALARLETIADDLLVEALPLAEQLATERHRGHVLEALLNARLTDDQLRLAGHSPVALVRRSAWRRLAHRHALSDADLDRVVRDTDVLVRAVAARLLPSLGIRTRRRLAEHLLNDPVGWVATPALAALVDPDGDSAIRPALIARTAPVRRAAQDWARLRGIDARAEYVERRALDPRDPVALLALADLAHKDDADLFGAMVGDDRARVAAAGLRALVRVDEPRGRAAAVDALRERRVGRVTWAAASVLRGATPSNAEAAALADVACDVSRSIGQRFRALSLLRPLRWRHLALVLEIRSNELDPSVRRRLDTELNAWLSLSGRIGRRPTGDDAERLPGLLAALDDRRRERIEFILRTSAG